MLIGFIVAIALLSGRAGEKDTYYTSYGDVSELKYGTKVLYMGYPVGQVEEIEPNWQAQTGVQFDLAMAIATEWRGQIPSDSIAEIKAAGQNKFRARLSVVSCTCGLDASVATSRSLPPPCGWVPSVRPQAAADG